VEITGEIMKKSSLVTLCAILVVLIFTSSCASAASSTTPASTSALDGATLVQERCSVCHPLTFVERSKHTASEWKLIVDMMISRGAQLNADEETLVVNYLASAYGK
jgi:hypothetical protein